MELGGKVKVLFLPGDKKGRKRGPLLFSLSCTRRGKKGKGRYRSGSLRQKRGAYLPLN